APSVAPSAAPSAAESAGAQPSIQVPSFSLPSEAKDLEAILPSTLCGATATKLSMNGSSFLQNSTDQDFAKALAVLGKTPADVSVALAADAAGSTGCTAGVFRIKGADPNLMKNAFLQAAAASSQGPTSEKDLGGKHVYYQAGTDSTDTNSYIYFNGDAVFFVSAKNDNDAASILQSMP